MNEWTPVNAQRPPRSGPYLCHCNRWGDSETQILTWFDDCSMWRKRYCMDDNPPADMTQYVDYWMYLPEAPSNETRGETYGP